MVLEGGNSSATAESDELVDGRDGLPQKPAPFVDPTNIVWSMQQVGPAVASIATNERVDALEDYWVVSAAH